MPHGSDDARQAAVCGPHHTARPASVHVSNCMQGLGKTCMYCGDGINDLAALAAADVGVAIGASDASAAATLSDRHCSIAGQLSFRLLHCTS